MGGVITGIGSAILLTLNKRELKQLYFPIQKLEKI
jgi:hypothetical protein